MKFRGTFIVGFLLLFLSVGLLRADTATIPNAFTAGTPIVASEVNDNFSALANSINDNDDRLKRSGQAGVQSASVGSSVDIDDISYIEVLSLAIPAAGQIDVSLTGHVYLERDATGNALYRIAIFEGTDCTGTVVGLTLSRSAVSSGGPDSGSIALTGFAKNITAPTNFALCVRKNLPATDNAVASARGLNAAWSPAAP